MESQNQLDRLCCSTVEYSIGYVAVDDEIEAEGCHSCRNLYDVSQTILLDLKRSHTSYYKQNQHIIESEKRNTGGQLMQ